MKIIKSNKNSRFIRELFITLELALAKDIVLSMFAVIIKNYISEKCKCYYHDI